jgi:antitoxin HicB
MARCRRQRLALGESFWRYVRRFFGLTIVSKLIPLIAACRSRCKNWNPPIGRSRFRVNLKETSIVMEKPKDKPLRGSWTRQDADRLDTRQPTKRLLACQLETAMKEKHFTKTEMARRMRTSRAAVDRLLNPHYEAVTLNTLRKAAFALGCELRLELV